jgi:hypothetical protein
MSACIFAANRLGNRLAADSDGSKAEDLPPAVAARCGGNLEELTVSLGDVSRIVAEARMFSQVGAAA